MMWDLETTGLKHYDRIIQFGFCYADLDTGEVLYADAITINPGIPIPRGSVKVHQIAQDDVSRLPPLEYAWDFITAHLSGEWAKGNGAELVILATHNGIDFDIPFIEREAERIGQRIEWTIPHVDTIDAAWGLDPGMPRRLAVVAKRHGVRLLKAHSAADDSEAGVLMLLAMIKRVGTLDRLVDLARRARRSLDLFGRTLIDTLDGILWLTKPCPKTPITEVPRKVLASAVKRGTLTPAARSVVRDELARRDGGIQQQIDAGESGGVRYAVFEQSVLQLCLDAGIDPTSDAVTWSPVFGRRVRTGLSIGDRRFIWRPIAKRGQSPVGAMYVEHGGAAEAVISSRPREIVEEVMGGVW